MPKAPKSILLADRDLADWRILTEVLSQIDKTIKIQLVTNSETLLQSLAESDETELPCLIILDYNPPGFDGLKVLERIKAESLYIKVPKIVWSAFINTEVENRCLEAGAVHCFHKPDKASELKAIAQSMVEYCHRNGYLR